MQTALHIYSLVNELKDRLIGSTFIGTEFYKKEREAYIHFKTSKGIFALGMVYHPVSFGTFLIPRGKVKIKTNEKPWPFFQDAYSSIIKNIEQKDFDRIISIELENDKGSFDIIIEAIGPNGNFWLTNNDHYIIATLRHKKYDNTIPYQPPAPLEKLDPFEIELRHLIEIFKKSDQYIENVLKKNIIGFDKKLINEILERTDIDNQQPAMEITNDGINAIVDQIKQIIERFGEFDRGYCYNVPGGNLAYPFKIRSLGSEYIKCKSLSFAVYEAIRSKKVNRSEIDTRQVTLDAIKRHIKRLKRKEKNIQKDIETAGNYEHYKKTAELIKINLWNINKGQAIVILEDIYSDSGDEVTIKLDPAISVAENADAYFKKYRKGREGLKLLERRSEIAQKELESVLEIQTEFETNYNSAIEKYESEIAAIMPKVADKKTAYVRLPYKETTLSTGVTVLIGRDGTDNDETTFHHAKPYELWFHASQCPGSHVVLKFPAKNFEPSKTEIEETASIAAYHSKARNSKHVPVIFAPRKYVRKPRKAKPGLVTVEREKMIMVEPKKEE